MADVRINEVTTDVTVSDASSLLSPELLDRLTAAVLARLADQQRAAAEADREQRIGEGS
jgi:hypothetical protein